MTVKRRPGEIVQVNLRMREDFRQRLLRAAEKGERSFNQELVRRLEESFRHPPAVDAEALERTEAMMAQQVVRAGELQKAWEDRFGPAFESRVAANIADRIKRLVEKRLKKAENEK